MKPATTIFLAALLSLGLTAPAMAEAGKMAETSGNNLVAAPTAWLGETLHFVMMGTINGTAFNIQMTDMAAATAVASFGAKREYKAIDTGFAYIDFEVALEAEIAGIERQIEIEMENASFSALTLPADLALQEAEFPEGLLSNLETQWEWEAEGASFNEEVTGWTGTLRLETDTGTADDKGLMGDGTIAGFITATRGEDKVAISFTAPVLEYEIED